MHHAGTDPAERKQLENEQEGWRTINAMFAESEGKFLMQLAEKEKALVDTIKALNATEAALNEKDNALNEKDQALMEMQKQFDELKRKLGEG